MLTYILKVAPKKLGEVAVHSLCMEDILHGVNYRGVLARSMWWRGGAKYGRTYELQLDIWVAHLLDNINS